MNAASAQKQIMEQNPFTSTAANEFADNPEPRCASLLILDVSVSM